MCMHVLTVGRGVALRVWGASGWWRRRGAGYLKTLGGPRGHRAVSLRVAWGRAEARREGSRAAGRQPASQPASLQVQSVSQPVR